MGKKSKKKGKGAPKVEGLEATNINNSVVTESVQASPSGIPPHLDEFASTLRTALVESFGAELFDAKAKGMDFEKVFREHLLPGNGWIPRYKFDPKMVMDLHAWCVDENGVVHDYPDEKLMKGDYATKDIVRRPWDVCVVVQALPHLEKWTKEQFFDKNPHVTTEQFLQAIKNNTFPSNNCYPRAKILRDSDPSKYALVLGSLGFRQSDGRVYWEYG